MRRTILAACSAGALCLIVAPVAMAAHNTPAKADKQTIPQVAAYKACATTPLTDPHNGGSPACAAVRNNPNYKFGPKGQVTSAVTVLKAGAKVKDISGKDMIPPPPTLGSTGPDIQIITNGIDVLDNAGTGITGNQQGFVWTRITDSNCPGPVSCTLGDLPFPIAHNSASTDKDCLAGVCAQATTGNLVVDNVFHAGIPAVVGGVGTNLQVGSACIRPSAPLPGPGIDATCQGIVVGKAPKTGMPAGFFAPAKSAKMVYPFVRDYQPQTNCLAPRTNVTHAAPLSFAACSEPLETDTALKFGPKGAGTVTISGKAGKAAAPPKPEVTGDAYADVKVGDVQTAGGTPYTGSLTFKTTVRVSHADCSGVPCTRPDQQVSIPVTCTNGACAAKKAPLGLNLPGAGISNVEIATQRNQPGTTASVTTPDSCLYNGSAAFACTGLYIP